MWSRECVDRGPVPGKAIFREDNIHFMRGHHELEWYDPMSKSIEHKLPCKVRWSCCHNEIRDEGMNVFEFSQV